MTSTQKRTYRKMMELFHNETKAKIMFLKWNDDGTAACLTADRSFLNLSREEIDTHYTSYAELNRRTREKRRGQGW